MKKPNLLTWCCCCCCCVLISAIALAAARSSAQALNGPSQGQAQTLTRGTPSNPGAPKPLLLNPKTWVLTEMDGTPIEGELNSAEAILERFYANLATQNPQEYERIFPKSDQKRGAIQDALRTAHNPKSLEQRLLEIGDPVKQGDVLRSIDGILNPRPVTAESLQALDASPAGPWSNVMQPYP